MSQILCQESQWIETEMVYLCSVTSEASFGRSVGEVATQMAECCCHLEASLPMYLEHEPRWPNTKFSPDRWSQILQVASPCGLQVLTGRVPRASISRVWRRSYRVSSGLVLEVTQSHCHHALSEPSNGDKRWFLEGKKTILFSYTKHRCPISTWINQFIYKSKECGHI